VVIASKAKYTGRPIENKYCEGNMKKFRLESEIVKIQESKAMYRTRIVTRTKEISMQARRRAKPVAEGN